MTKGLVSSPAKPLRASTKRTGLWIGIAVIVLAAAAGAIWYIGQSAQPRTSAAGAKQSYQTQPIRRGSLSETVAGTAVLSPGQSFDLSFPVSGVVAGINVQLGDRVTVGQTLAWLDNQDALKLAVASKQLALQTAQTTLNQVANGGEQALAQARADLAAAQAQVAADSNNLRQSGVPRCSAQQSDAYYWQYVNAQKALDPWEAELANPNSKYGRNYILQQVDPLRKARDLAYENWIYCGGYTTQEIQSAQAAYNLAQAQVAAGQAQVTKLQAVKGVDPTALAIAQAAVTAAQAQLDKAKNDLTGATMIAPVSGTVLAVNGTVGQNAGSAAFITIGDLDHPLVAVKIDETDLQGFQIGCSAQVSFTSIPGRVFAGELVQVSPLLLTSRNVSSVQGTVSLTDSAPTDTPFIDGLDGSADIVCSQAANVLIAPVGAVYGISGGQAHVFILGADGKPQQQNVQVGLQNIAFVEITSGLSEGQQVIVSGPGLK